LRFRLFLKLLPLHILSQNDHGHVQHDPLASPPVFRAWHRTISSGWHSTGNRKDRGLSREAGATLLAGEAKVQPRLSWVSRVGLVPSAAPLHSPSSRC